MKLPSVAILAGGLATRLQSVSQTIPKSLIDIDGQPFIFHQLRLLSQNGIRDVVLCLGHLGKMIEDAVGNGNQFELNVSYSYDGPQLVGTGGAIKKALPLLTDPFFVLYGDSYLECDYKEIASSFLASGKKGLMTVLRNENLWDSSNVEFQNGRILAYNKLNRTAKMQHIDYGLGIFHKAAFATIPDNQFDLSMVYNILLQEDQLSAFEVQNRFFEIGSPAGLEETCRHLKSKTNL